MATRAPNAVLDRLVEAYLADEPFSGSTAGGGEVRLDRRLPYLLVHRRRAAARHRPIEELLSGEASYALLPEHEPEDNAELARRLAQAGAGAYGAFLLMEVWEGSPGGAFAIHGPRDEARPTLEALREGLEEVRAVHPGVRVEVEPSWERHPPDLPPLLGISECHELGCLLVGLQVPPLYRADGGAVSPVFLRALRRVFSRVLRKALFEFVRVQGHDHGRSWHVLGRRTVDDAFWEGDRELAEIERCYDLLLLISPVDEDDAWERFRASGFEENPEFHYRLLPVDPDLLKRRLYDIPLERVTDPAAAFLLRDKRDELDKQISLMADRGSPNFLHSSIRLYGGVGPRLLALAREILDGLPAKGPAEPWAEPVDAVGFRDAAVREIDRYRRIWPNMAPEVQVRPDVTGLLVSKGHLLIGASLRIARHRLRPLLMHEVGTHVLTFWNGRAQRFSQLAYGLADYDELQEGLAVFAEYLVDGLDVERMRILAGRVVAAHAVQAGADFVETFRLLHGDYGFSAGAAHGVASRVQAGGGFTRDLIYLRGLVDLLDYLRDGGALEPLYMGKMARKHLSAVEELRERGVLREPPLRPLFLDDEGARRRLEAAGGDLPLGRMVRGASP